MNLPDMQKSTEGFKKIAINKVGMRNVELPFSYFHPDVGHMLTRGVFSSYCNLVEDVKGINMSRISRGIIDVVQNNDFASLGKKGLFVMMGKLVEHLANAHNTDDIFAKVKFNYPLYRSSPYTKLDSPEYLRITLDTFSKAGNIKHFVTIERIGMSLCPCSKEMSLLTSNLTDSEKQALVNADLPVGLLEKISMAGFGAHNQRSHVELKMEVADIDSFVIEDVIEAIDTSYSCTTKTVLKRPDEKYETEVSYLGGFFDEKDGKYTFVPVEGSGPKFVEDIVRDIADKLNASFLDKTIKDYAIVCQNSESIHSGDIEAVAVLTAGRDLT